MGELTGCTTSVGPAPCRRVAWPSRQMVRLPGGPIDAAAQGRAAAPTTLQHDRDVPASSLRLLAPRLDDDGAVALSAIIDINKHS